MNEFMLLEEYIDQLEFFDKSNREGHAAKVYFMLFSVKISVVMMIHILTPPLTMGMGLFFQLLIVR